MINANPIAIIPARLGSNRVKLKNILNFNKKPLIFWTIEAAMKSNIFSNIFISTDSNLIKNKLSRYKNNIIFLKRPKKYSGKNTKSETLIKHLIKKNQLHKKFETIFLLQATSPYRNQEHIRSMWKIYKKKKLKNFVSVGKKKNKDHIEKKKFVFIKNKKIQLKKNLYLYPNGAIYIRNISDFLKDPKFLTKKSYYFLMNNKSSLDIDNYEDFNH